MSDPVALTAFPGDTMKLAPMKHMMLESLQLLPYPKILLLYSYPFHVGKSIGINTDPVILISIILLFLLFFVA